MQSTYTSNTCHRQVSLDAFRVTSFACIFNNAMSEKEKELGRRILERLTLLRKTQRGLAAHCGVSVQAVSDWVRGKSRPRGKHIEQAAQYLECSAAWLEYGVASSPLVEGLRNIHPDQAMIILSLLDMLTNRQRNACLENIMELVKQNQELLRELEKAAPRPPPIRKMLSDVQFPKSLHRKKLAK